LKRATLSDATTAAIHRWVTAKFGLDADQALGAGIVVKLHGAALTDYPGVYIWRMRRVSIISAPAELVTDVRWALEAVGIQPADALVEERFWRAALGQRVERIIGPSYQGFMDAGAFHTAETLGARPLTASDRPALQRFIADCPPDDWRDSAIALDHDPLIGLERLGELVALASAPLDGPAETAMRSVGVVTLPAARGTGAGLAVVSALTERCLALGATLHYQTLRANLPSIAIAQRLGFEDVATSLAVRLG
jgi:GNAT superfamily N-acetyltransferase